VRSTLDLGPASNASPIKKQVRHGSGSLGFCSLAASPLPLAYFTRVVNEWPNRLAGMEVRVTYVRKGDLPDYLFPKGKKPTLPARERSKKRKSTGPPPENAKRQKMANMRTAGNAVLPAQPVPYTQQTQPTAPQASSVSVTDTGTVSSDTPSMLGSGTSLANKQVKSTPNKPVALEIPTPRPDELSLDNSSVLVHEPTPNNSKKTNKPVINLLSTKS